MDDGFANINEDPHTSICAPCGMAFGAHAAVAMAATDGRFAASHSAHSVHIRPTESSSEHRPPMMEARPPME